MLRTKQELDKAQQELKDLFYPRKIYVGKCEHCERISGENHTPGCLSFCSSFQGWQGSVKRIKNIDITKSCDKKDCLNKVEVRIRLNIWGSLYELDVCKKCGTIDGKSRDGMRVDDL